MKATNNNLEGSVELDQSLLLDDLLLSHSGEWMDARDEVDNEERYSSRILPKGMDELSFQKFCYFLFRYFEKSNDSQFLGSKGEYESPEAIYFKGSSVTCLKYSNDGIDCGIRTFGPESDYDVGLVSQAGIDAMRNLVNAYHEIKKTAPLDIANQIANLISKIDPGNTDYLDIHNKDKNAIMAEDCAKRNFFPEGTPHILFCNALNQFVDNDHEFNFVMVSSLAQLKYPFELVEDASLIVDSASSEFLALCQGRVRAFVHSDKLKGELFRYEGKDYDHPRPVLVYSWKLVEVYHNAYLNKNPDKSTELSVVFHGLHNERDKQRDYARDLMREARKSKQDATLFCNQKRINAECQSTSNLNMRRE